MLWSGSTSRAELPDNDRVTGILRAVTRPLIKAMIASSSSYVAYGTAAKRYLVSLGAPADRIVLTFNTVDTELWARSALDVDRAVERRELGLEDRVEFLYVVQLIARKGLDVLLEAMRLASKQRDDLGLVIVGAGQRETELRQRIRAMGLDDRICLVGHVSQTELPRYYAACDVVVLPSSQEKWG